MNTKFLKLILITFNTYYLNIKLFFKAFSLPKFLNNKSISSYSLNITNQLHMLVNKIIKRIK